MGFERLYGGRLLRSSFFKKKIKLESKINQIDKESKQAGVYFLFFFFPCTVHTQNETNN